LKKDEADHCENRAALRSRHYVVSLGFARR
jgi:hypothetical protein